MTSSSTDASPSDAALRAFTRLCPCARTLDTTEKRQVDKLGEICKVVMQKGVDKLITDVGGGALLTTKSADGTPLRVAKRYRFKAASGSTVLRGGHIGAEYLLKNQFVRAITPGGVVTKALVQQPMQLDFGKGAGAIFEACAKDWQSLRSMGHTGCAIEHYVYDRCGIDAQARMWRQWHAHNAHRWGDLAIDMTVKQLRLSEFIVVTPCAAHDAQSALRWAMQPESQDSALVRDIYVTLESLRNSIDLIHLHMGDWIASRLEFVPPMSEEAVERRRLVWQALDLEHEVVETLAEMQLTFAEGKIQVTDALLTSPIVLDTISTALKSAFRFIRFSDSRWLTVGASCRILVAGHLLGLDDLVEEIIDNPDASKYYLGGYRRMSSEPNRKRFVVEAAFTSRAIDGVMSSIMDDSRVARNYDELFEVLCEDVQWLATTAPHIWEVVAGFAKCDGAELRSSIMARTHVAFHFFNRRVLEPAADLPWRLCRGDLSANLEAMCAGDEPSEPVSSQMWQLVETGFPKERLLPVLELLADAPWSTTIVEQQHGQVSVVHRHHPDFERGTLTSRSFLLFMSRLLPSVSQDEKQLDRLYTRIQKLMQKQPDKITGSNMLVRALFQHLNFRDNTISDREAPKNMKKKIFKSHAQIWHSTALTDRRCFEGLARLRNAEVQKEIEEEAEALRAQRQLLIDRMDQSDERPPVKLSESSFTEAELSKIGELFMAQEPFTPTAVVRLKESAMECPPPDPSHEAALGGHEVWEHPGIPQPAWAKAVIRNRDYFKDTALLINRHDGPLEYFKFIYAVQQPHYLALSPMRLADDFGVDLTSGAFDFNMPPAPKWRFHCNLAKNISAAEVSEAILEDVFVIPACRHTDGLLLESPCDTEPLKLYLDQLPEVVAHEPQQKKTKTHSKTHEDMVEKFPWVAHLDHKVGFEPSQTKDDEADEPDQSDGGGGYEELDVHLQEATMKALDAARREVAALPAPLGVVYFKVRVLGGDFTQETEGRPISAIQGYACTKRSIKFCTRRLVQQSMRFDVDLNEGRPNCSILARGFCHRMQFFMEAEEADDTLCGRAFPLELVDSYVETSEFQRFLLIANPESVRRVQDVRALFR